MGGNNPGQVPLDSIKRETETPGMTQWIKPLAAKPDDLSSIPGPTLWKEAVNSHELSSEPSPAHYGRRGTSA